MRKKIRRYNQTSMVTCGPACMLMLLDFMDTPIGKIYLAVSGEESQ